MPACTDGAKPRHLGNPRLPEFVLQSECLPWPDLRDNRCRPSVRDAIARWARPDTEMPRAPKSPLRLAGGLSFSRTLPALNFRACLFFSPELRALRYC